MKGLDELYVAYTLIWLGLFVYMVFLHWRQSKLTREIENLKGVVKGHGRKG